MDAMKNASPGSIKLKRGALKCKMNNGDGDPGDGSRQLLLNDGDGVPASGRADLRSRYDDRGRTKHGAYIHHHRASLVEVHYTEVDFCSLLVPEVSCVYARYEGCTGP